jgi:hypothetical protein
VGGRRGDPIPRGPRAGRRPRMLWRPVMAEEDDEGGGRRRRRTTKAAGILWGEQTKTGFSSCAPSYCSSVKKLTSC